MAEWRFPASCLPGAGPAKDQAQRWPVAPCQPPRPGHQPFLAPEFLISINIYFLPPLPGSQHTALQGLYLKINRWRDSRHGQTDRSGWSGAQEGMSPPGLACHHLPACLPVWAWGRLAQAKPEDQTQTLISRQLNWIHIGVQTWVPGPSVYSLLLRDATGSWDVSIWRKAAARSSACLGGLSEE